MRTTVSLDDDVAAAVEEARRSRHLGLSEAVNDLIRAGLATVPPARRVFHQRSSDLGLRIDVSNVAEALDVLDGPTAR
jgi:Arc/MetJ family transcription regulator